MKLPVGVLKGRELETIFGDSIVFHRDSFYATLSEYEPNQLYDQWRLLVRSIDEIINIPFELNDQAEEEAFLSLQFDLFVEENLRNFGIVLKILESRFDKGVALRFKNMVLMAGTMDKVLGGKGYFEDSGNQFSLSGVKEAREYFQSRRIYYVTTLNLIPQVAKGSKKIEMIDILNYLFYPLDSCLVNITSAYYNLLLNHCVENLEIVSDGRVAKRNYNYNHLESFFLEPQRLSLLDQMDLRAEKLDSKPLLSKPLNKVFSFAEVANSMITYNKAFNIYDIESKKEYIELNDLLLNIAPYVNDDYEIRIEKLVFEGISAKYKSLQLCLQSSEYFENLSSYSPFQRKGNEYYSTVVLLMRFITRTLTEALMNNRTFQIHSGFVFEDKISKLLDEKGFKDTKIKRINRKEFDVVTIKNGIVYNFQCKNNFIDISNINNDVKKIGNINSRLCRYYDNALKKEIGREHLLKSRTGLTSVKHYVISRYPVISQDKRIINYNDLNDWNSN